MPDQPKKTDRHRSLRIPLPADEAVADLLKVPPPPEKKRRGKRVGRSEDEPSRENGSK